MADEVDFMLLLPEPLSVNVLEFLDAETLFNCTQVSRHWNEITDLLQPEIWFKACLNADIQVKRNDYKGAREWKAFFCSMVERLRDMKASNCYESFYYTFQQPPRAISCHNERLSVVFNDYFVIMDTSHDRQGYVATVACHFESSFLRFDGNTLAAASTDGQIFCWSVVFQNQFNESMAPRRTLLSFDFLTGYSILVGSSRTDHSTSIIYIWRIFGERVCSEIDVNDKIIHRVLLAPDPDSPAGDHQGKTCFLFGLAEDCVRVWIVEIRSLSFSAQVLTTFTIPPDPNIHGDVDDTPPFGFLFDGTELFIMTPSPERSPRIIWAWNFREGTKRCLESSHPVINLLGVGKKYLVYKLRIRDDRNDIVCAVDKMSNDIGARIKAPRITSTSDGHICLGNTSWMDGLNGANDSGVVFASVKSNPLQVAVVTFLPRSE